MGCGASKQNESSTASKERSQEQQQDKSAAPNDSNEVKKNTALVFIKPHANNDAVNTLVKEKLSASNFNILSSGTVDGPKIDSDRIIDQHYATISRYAIDASADQLPVPAETKEKFNEKFGKNWDELVAAGSIINAKAATEKLGGISAADLTVKWKASTTFKLAPGLYVANFESDDIFVINGFFLLNREKFTKEGVSVNWFVIEWEERAMTWSDFRGQFIGPTNPEAAPEGSLRGIIMKDWSSLGLAEQPNVSDNGVHASAGPIEGLNERIIWTGASLENDAYGKELQGAGVDMSVVKEWLANPVVEVEGVSAPAYDHLEDKQSSDVLEILKKVSKKDTPVVEEKKAVEKEEQAPVSANGMTFAILQQQDDVTSNATLKMLEDSEDFKQLATNEGNGIIKRDQEDEEKLSAGIKIAVEKGVLKADPDVPAIKQINVVGKSADAVADELISQLPGKEGNVIILQGLSGTGKGTTVGKVTKALSNCVTWSNGNVFRTITWLVWQHCEAEGVEFSGSVLTPELLSKLVARLKFQKFEDGFDVVIDEETRVSTIANTELKKPNVSSNVPTVAEQTQGEVVLFAASAIEQLSAAGHNVVIEGRAQTLQYIPSTNRFELVISDPALLGQRRAAQRVMAGAKDALAGKEDAAEAEVKEAVENTLKGFLSSA